MSFQPIPSQSIPFQSLPSPEIELDFICETKRDVFLKRVQGITKQIEKLHATRVKRKNLKLIKTCDDNNVRINNKIIILSIIIIKYKK